MIISVDAYGGDNAPMSVIKGCAEAVAEYDIKILLAGKTEELKKLFEENNISQKNIEFVNASEIITMHDDPASVVRSKKDSSMAVAFQLLKDGKADAFVSAGNTGALYMGATFIVKRIKNIKRAALASLIPTDNGKKLLMDCGANTDNTVEQLVQFAVMGSVYMEKVIGVESPKVGLLNNGTEDTKGDDLRVETNSVLKTLDINYVGNVEGRDIPFGNADVYITDGFSGNLVLKAIEGTALSMMCNVKNIFKKNIMTKLCALILKSGLYSIKEKMDYREYGGAPLLGISKPVIKAHGSCDETAFKNAIHQAVIFTRENVVGIIEDFANEQKKEKNSQNNIDNKSKN